MKKTHIFAFASTCVLLAAGVLATKANKKLFGPTSVSYFKPGNTTTAYSAFTGASTDILTTNQASANAAFFTVGSSTYKLTTSASPYHTLYLPSGF